MHATKVVTLFSATARTASANGSSVGTGERTDSVMQSSEGYTRHMHVFTNTTAFTSGTNDVSVEGSVDGGTTWFTLTPSSAWTQITGTGKQVRRYEGPIPPLVRGVQTLAGGPNITTGMTALLGG